MNFCLTSEFMGSYLEIGHKESGPISNYKKNSQESFYLKKDPRILEGDTGQKTIGNPTVILLVKSKSRRTGPESSWGLSRQKQKCLEMFWICLPQIRIISILGLTQGHLCLQKVFLVKLSNAQSFKIQEFSQVFKSNKSQCLPYSSSFLILVLWRELFWIFLLVITSLFLNMFTQCSVSL